MSPAGNPSARELIQELRGRGLSTADIAGELRRDPRMVRKVLNGETSGAAYRETLQELATTGRATTVPARRRAKDGHIVPVLGKGGDGGKTVVPKDTGGRYTNAKQGGPMRSTTYMGGGGRQVELQVPKGKTAKGRQAGNVEVMNAIRAAARGQSRENQKRIRATLTYANGRVMEVNDYNASTLLNRLNRADGKALEWLTEQMAERYSNLDTSKNAITGVSLTVYETPKTEQYHRNRAGRRS